MAGQEGDTQLLRFATKDEAQRFYFITSTHTEEDDDYHVFANFHFYNRKVLSVKEALQMFGMDEPEPSSQGTEE